MSLNDKVEQLRKLSKEFHLSSLVIPTQEEGYTTKDRKNEVGLLPGAYNAEKVLHYIADMLEE